MMKRDERLTGSLRGQSVSSPSHFLFPLFPAYQTFSSERQRKLTRRQSPFYSLHLVPIDKPYSAKRVCDQFGLVDREAFLIPSHFSHSHCSLCQFCNASKFSTIPIRLAHRLSVPKSADRNVYVCGSKEI